MIFHCRDRFLDIALDDSFHDVAMGLEHLGDSRTVFLVKALPHADRKRLLARAEQAVHHPQDYGVLGRLCDGQMKFHLAIAQATKNPVILRMMDSLLSSSQQPLSVSMRQRFYEEDGSRIAQMLETHRNIVEAIIERNIQKTIAAMEDHFDLLIKQLYFDKAAEP